MLTFFVRRAAAFLSLSLSTHLLPDMAYACNCKGHLEVRSGNFKPDVPKGHFEVHHQRGNGQSDKACRRDAREHAHACLSALWRERWDNISGGIPDVCQGLLPSGGPIFRNGRVPFKVKRSLERAACCNGSPIRNAHNAPGDIYARTHGDKGCGPRNKTVDSRKLHDNYIFDCKAVRARGDCGLQDSRIGSLPDSGTNGEPNTDRPGMDLPGMPLTVNVTAGSCRRACRDRNGQDGREACRSWTFVERAANGRPQCWLKGGVPWAKRQLGMQSGTVR